MSMEEPKQINKEINSELINIEVVFAGEPKTLQFLIALQVPSGTTVKEAVILSRILDLIPINEHKSVGEQEKSIDNRLGIFGEKVSPNTVLKAGDRVEIYRDLKFDPKEARRLRVSKERKALKK